MKKVFVNLIIPSLFFTSVNAAESGGMPQLNPEFWLSQIFWLTITFGILYIVLAKLKLINTLNKLSNGKNVEKVIEELADEIASKNAFHVSKILDESLGGKNRGK